ncbi:MAG TPA: sigma factor-like helix-turn-helix DNA-binding protein [Candidatus Saccharimonadales bacterium]|nr:sigma factor-like helix-turn-helix DNA-binding protein [Candidatus Saccharimonadales bacterium]
MAQAEIVAQTLDTEQYVQDILTTIDRDREREIIARRFGLFDRKETLEQIGELLNITRERVRQLEKSVIARLKTQAEQGQLPHITEIEQSLCAYIQSLGHTSRVSNLSSILTAENSRTDQSRVAFLATLCPGLYVIDDTDHYFQAIGITNVRDEKSAKEAIASIIAAIKKRGEPAEMDEVVSQTTAKSADEAEALASVSKDLATLNSQWGLIKWPMVNPKNIRDKIYVILKNNDKHMHFNEIAEAIKESDFKRRDVTTQAIHNELIKDKRFVLIGRGIYALKEWGYQKGTVADIITDVLRDAGEPLHRDEIVKRVLASRFVKETTILLNLQGKPQFKRVAKATYALAE